MLPHLMGSFIRRKSGGTRCIQWLHPAACKGHFVRAILEGVSYNLRHILDALGQAGLHFGEIRSSGGGARSPLWNQIKADVCGLPIVTLANEEGCIAWRCHPGGCGLRHVCLRRRGLRQMVAIHERIQPGEAQAAYEIAYRGMLTSTPALGRISGPNYSG